MYDSIIFDLDGTIWDVSEACAKGWNNALDSCQINDFFVTSDDIRKVSGLPFEECVSTLFEDVGNVELQNLSRAIDHEERREIALIGGELYEGVIKGISELSKEFPLFLVSNCQDWYLEFFWSVHGLQCHFKGYDCHGSSGIPKSEMISRMCRENSLNRPIYIGDTKGDQVASKEAGVAFGLVTYGFGDTEEADHFFSTFEELATFFRDKDVSPNKKRLWTRSAPQL